MSATISPRLSQLIRRWHAIDADWRQKLAEAERLYGAHRETLESVSTAIVDTHADAARSEAMAIAAFPAQSLADIAAKCAFAAKEKDDYELSVATVETTAEDAERLAGEGGASSALVQMAQREASTRARADAGGDEREVIHLWHEALAAVAAFPAQSAADVALKLRTAVAWEGDIRQTAENGDNADNAARAIVAALADLDRLAEARVTA
jgi:hypothetical protein